MTEENNTGERFEPQDPSEQMKRILSDGDGGHDPGDEHKDPEPPAEVKDEQPKTEAETPKPSVEMKSVDDYIDEDLASVVSKLMVEINSLKSAKRQQEGTAKVDDLVSSLGDDWAPVFKDKANRAKLETAIGVLRVGYERSNVPVPDEQEIIQKALRSEFADIKSGIEKEEVQSKVDDRRSQMISRASGRRSDSLSPKESAMKSVHQIMVDRGLYNS